MSRPRALLLDIDGTLLDGSSGAYLADRFGHADQVAQAERAYNRGECSNDDVCRIDASGWAGRSITEVDKWLAQMPVREGVAHVAGWASRRDLIVLLASVAWRPVSESLQQRFGFLTTGGPEPESLNGVYTGQVAQFFDEYAKRDMVLSAATHLGIPAAQCIAVGDSRSDIPLFASCGMSVAFNASESARQAATATVDGPTFLNVLDFLDEIHEDLRL